VILFTHAVNVAKIRKKVNKLGYSQFPITGPQLNFMSVSSVIHKFPEGANSKRFSVFPEEISNSSRFPLFSGFQEVVDTLFTGARLTNEETNRQTEGGRYRICERV